MSNCKGHNLLPRSVGGTVRPTATLGSLRIAFAVLAVVAGSLLSCSENPVTPFSERFAVPIEEAHGLDAWRSKPALRAHLIMGPEESPSWEADLTFDVSLGRSRMEFSNGDLLVFDGRDAWVSPASSERKRARFHLLTWPYFIAAGFKLRDQGAHLDSLGPLQLKETGYRAAKLTFSPGTGDSPDDFYVVYADRETSLLRSMAYIVTYGKSVDEASDNPHAIVYEDYVRVDGVTLSNRWTFWNWAGQEKGIVGAPLNEATLTNFEFVTPDPGAFSKPDDARRDELPAK